ncbi:MAG: amino acid adenylation domain-containing protein, partial [Saprospiraceae bacterium]
LKLSPTHYVWFFNQHHLFTDGWSLTVLFQTLADFYQKALNNDLENVSDLPSFQDYLAYEKKLQHSSLRPKINKYWQQKVATLPKAPRLYGRQALQQASSRAQRISVGLGELRSQQLRALTKEKDLRAFSADLSLFHIFSTILFTYLHRVSGEQNLVIGSPSHNRPKPIFKKTLGAFLEIFPLQIEIAATDTFMDVFNKVRTETGNYLRHAQAGVSFPALSGSFNVLLNFISGQFKDADQTVGKFNGLPIQSEWLLPEHIDPAHHLRLQIHDFDGTGELRILFDFNEAIFYENLRANAIDHFLTIVDAFIENRQQTILTPPIITEQEEALIIENFNATERVFLPQQQHLLTHFEAQVKRTPHAPALLFGEQTLTYQQFNAKANQLARFLQNSGIGTEDVVALCLERSFEMLIAIYGILKAGAAYLPIDTQHPAERIDFILEDASAKMLLVAGSTPAIQHDLPLFDLQNQWTEIAPELATNLNLVIDPQHLSYVIYTSGSTGNPKGVATEHASITNRLEWMKELIQLDETDVILQKTPYTFDVSIPEFFWCLQLGARMVIARPDGHKDPTYLVETIQKYGITTIHFVPSLLTVFLETRDLDKLTTLRRFSATGEAITTALEQQYFRKFRQPLYNLYGPTEAAVEVTYWRCQPQPDERTVPIGVPGANTQIYILDAEKRLVPIGTPGELYISGIQLARGYVNRSELTTERFVPNPFSQDEDAKMYRSGDLARYRPDGVIEYLGRVDYQVKLRGFRIELGEIETHLDTHPQVAQAVVVVREEVVGAPYLLAYYMGDQVDSTEQLKGHLAAKLPDYMIPNQFMYLDELPLGSAGKVDRKALPVPNITAVAHESTYVAPEGQLEEIVAAMWSELLGVEKIGRYDSFIYLGGHSLTAIRLVSRLWDELELPVEINAIFKHPTLTNYATHLEEVMSALLAEENG